MRGFLLLIIEVEESDTFGLGRPAVLLQQQQALERTEVSADDTALGQKHFTNRRLRGWLSARLLKELPGALI
jgi:hypothetical protein